jgi:DNA-binding MarR family transcriptional regulator
MSSYYEDVTPPARSRRVSRQAPASPSSPASSASPSSSLAPDGAEWARLLDALSFQGRRGAAYLGMLNRAVASRMKLNATDIETLGVLAVLGATTPTRLASLMAMGTGSMTLVIDRLERAGFVRRVRDTKDRRSLTVEFVPERRPEIAALYAPLQRHAAEIAEQYTERDLAVIADYLTRSNDLLRDLAISLTEGPAPHHQEDESRRS